MDKVHEQTRLLSGQSDRQSPETVKNPNKTAKKTASAVAVFLHPDRAFVVLSSTFRM
jgi:hypothetical protein